ncbi:MAG: ADP-ribosylation factor-like protein [Candidatus Hodarchaeota archaeon]
MKELFEYSVIKGLVFSTYDKLGPQPFYMFPEYISDNEFREYSTENDKRNLFKLTLRDYTQISIKNLSLFISDGKIPGDNDFQNIQYFAILPHPDFNATSLTYFHYIKTNFSESPLATSFSILVDENSRSFLYNNINRIKPLILEFFSEFDKDLLNGYKEKEVVEPLFEKLLKKLIEIEKTPSTIITSKRKMKILFSGLDDSGKTSFLLSVDRKYSKLIGLKPTAGAKVNSIEALGATIFLWDLGGQLVYRKRYLSKAHIYLYEADLLFYFIDLKNRDRFEESIDYLLNIKKILNEYNQHTPIIYILSKGDSDILNTDEIQENVNIIKEKLKEINHGVSLEIHVTSIFQIFTILRAFSSGISKLSPNREIINYNLKTFSMKTNVYLTLLLSSDGLVLADFYSSEAKKLIEIPKSELINVFEITAPQFAIIYKIFSKFKTLQKEEAIFKVADSVVIFRKISITDNNMFILFLVDDESKEILIDKQLDNFLDYTKDLLLRYIS